MWSEVLFYILMVIIYILQVTGDNIMNYDNWQEINYTLLVINANVFVKIHISGMQWGREFCNILHSEGLPRYLNSFSCEPPAKVVHRSQWEWVKARVIFRNRETFL